MSKIYEALLQAEQDRETGVAGEAGAPDEPTETVKSTSPLSAIPSAMPRVVMSPSAFQPAVDTINPGLNGPAVELSPSPAAAPVPVPTLPAPAAVVGVTSLPPQPPVIAPPAVLPPAIVQPSAQVSLGPAQATYRIWHPNLVKLPAAQARGNQVEQFRSLRSKLFEFRDLNTLKTILVSSGRPAEGKSFVAINLAISFARHKSARVLLIDGDMRRSSLHHLLGCPTEPGLADYLAGKATLSEIMQRGKMEDDAGPMPAGLSFLTFIPAGEGGDKAADLSGSARFKVLIDELSPHFDWIIVDSSPVNLVTDSVNLARACDGVLLIARGGVTRLETAQRALVELKSSKVLGVVLNAVDDAPLADGYYGYDNYDSAKEQSIA